LLKAKLYDDRMLARWPLAAVMRKQALGAGPRGKTPGQDPYEGFSLKKTPLHATGYHHHLVGSLDIPVVGCRFFGESCGRGYLWG